MPEIPPPLSKEAAERDARELARLEEERRRNLMRLSVFRRFVDLQAKRLQDELPHD